MTGIIGKVLDKATIDSFEFVSDKRFDAKFVEVKAEHILSGAVIVGEILEKEALNPYFEKPTDVRYLSEEDETISERSLYSAKVKLIAIIQNGRQSEVSFPPLPGSNVFEASQTNIRAALELADNGIDMGFLKGYNLSFKIPPNKLFKTHISIVGQTGSGKSYFAAKIAAELLKLRHHAEVPSTIPIPIIFDSSGEYSGETNFGEQKCLSLLMNIISIKEHNFPLLNERYLPLLYDIYDINEKQESELRSWFLYTDNNSREIQDSQQQLLKIQDNRQLVNEFHQLRISSSKQLAGKLEDFLKRFNMGSTGEKISIPYNAISKMRKFNLKIKKTDDMDIIEQLSDGLIINLSDQDNYDERQITMLLVLRQLYEAAKTKKLNSKIVLFIDEAHNYVPSVYKSFCKEEILRLAREGRKYGITLCLISQRPRWVDPTALSQCGNLFIFKIQNSDDKKYIFDSASLPDSIRDINIAKFKMGEMIITGDVVNQPVNCIVSPIDTDFISLSANENKEEAMKKMGLTV